LSSSDNDIDFEANSFPADQSVNGAAFDERMAVCARQTAGTAFAGVESAFSREGPSPCWNIVESG
jgi:hypothetical protein